MIFIYVISSILIIVFFIIDSKQHYTERFVEQFFYKSIHWMNNITNEIEVDKNIDQFIDRLFKQAIHCHQNHDLDHALLIYEKVLSIDSNCTDAWLNKGNILSQKGDFDSTLTCYHKALNLADYHKELIFSNIGTLERYRGNLDSAITYYRKALQENRQYGQGWLELIQALISGRRGEETNNECSNFMLNCTVEDWPLYSKAKRLVDQFLQFGIICEPGDHIDHWIK